MNALAFTSIMIDAARAPLADLSTLTGTGDVVVLAPHPDDESLAMGGAIAAASAAGHRVQVVIVTDGSRSHPNSRSHPPDRLAALRRSEAELAVAILTNGGPAPLWLGFPDMYAPDSPGTYAAVEEVLAPHFASATALWTTWNGDPHPDHRRAWRMARWLVDRHPHLALHACPVWGRVQRPFCDATTDGMTRFDTRRYRDTKARAVAAHVSQMTGLISDDPDGFRMPRELAEHFIHSEEIFIPT